MPGHLRCKAKVWIKRWTWNLGYSRLRIELQVFISGRCESQPNTRNGGTEFGNVPIPRDLSIFPIPWLWPPACYFKSQYDNRRRQTPA